TASTMAGAWKTSGSTISLVSTRSPTFRSFTERPPAEDVDDSFPTWRTRMPNRSGWGSSNGSGWFSARTAISFGAGALMMLTASRIAPPFAGRAIGSLRSMTGTDPFDALAQDHRKVLALLDRLAETDNAATMRRAAMLFQVKRMLTAHALAEEDIIYPMLHDDARRVEEAKKLYREHA